MRNRNDQNERAKFPSHIQRGQFRDLLCSGLPEAALFLAGTTLFFTNLLGFDRRTAILLYVVAMASAMIGAVVDLFMLGKLRGRAYDLPAMVALLVIITRFRAVTGGTLLVINRVLAQLNHLYEESFSLLPMEEVPFSAELFVLVISLLLVRLLCRPADANKAAGLWSASLTTAAIFILSALFLQKDTVSSLLLIGGLTAYWMLRVSPLGMWQRFVWMTACLVILGAAAFWGSDTVPFMTAFREASKRQIKLIRYGEDTLPEGNLYEASALREDGEVPRLYVQSDLQNRLYLRGFTGDRYQDGVWKPLAGAAFSGADSGILAWLAGEDFYPLMQYGAYQKAGGAAAIPNYVNIVNEGANRSYYYESFSMTPSPAFANKARRDNRFASHALFGIRKTVFEEQSTIQPMELLLADDWLWNPQTAEEVSYVEDEKVYRDFVYRHYTEVTPQLEQPIHELFHSEKHPDGVYAATIRIRGVMEQKLLYMDPMGEIPEDRDPIRWFLSGNGGNAVLFASTAVEAYRSFGIPARYVEGYLYTPDETTSDGYAQLLTSLNAHAWCEVYMDGMGWMPVDVTPGYYYSTYSMLELMGAPDGIQKAHIEEDNTIVPELPRDAGPAKSTGDTPLWRQLGSMMLGELVLAVIAVLAWLILIFVLRLIILTVGEARAKKNTNAYVDYIWRRIRALLWAVGIEATLGVDAQETEASIMERMAGFQEGMYTDLNQVMEHFYYGGAETALRPYETQQLFNFYEVLGQEIHQMRWQDRVRIWYRDTRALLKRKGTV